METTTYVSRTGTPVTRHTMTIREWLGALRSGQYRLGRSQLFDGVGHCCLGVGYAHAVGLPNTIAEFWNDGSQHNDYSDTSWWGTARKSLQAACVPDAGPLYEIDPENPDRCIVPVHRPTGGGIFAVEPHDTRLGRTTSDMVDLLAGVNDAYATEGFELQARVIEHFCRPDAEIVFEIGGPPCMRQPMGR
jgi:hypothetical protein